MIAKLFHRLRMYTFYFILNVALKKVWEPIQYYLVIDLCVEK